MRSILGAVATTTAMLVLVGCTARDNGDADASPTPSPSALPGRLAEDGAAALLQSRQARLHSYAVLPSGDVLATWYADNQGLGKAAVVWIDSSGRSKSWLMPARPHRDLETAEDGFLLRPDTRNPKVRPVMVDGEGNLSEVSSQVNGQQPPEQLGTYSSPYLTEQDTAGRRWSNEPYDIDRIQASRRVSWWQPGHKDQRRSHTVPFFTEIRIVSGPDIAFIGNGTEELLVDHSPDGGRSWQSLTAPLPDTARRLNTGAGVEFTAVTDDGWAIGNVREQSHLRVNAQDPASVQSVDVPPGFMPPQPAGNLIYAEELFNDNAMARDLRLIVSADHGDTWRKVDLKGN